MSIIAFDCLFRVILRAEMLIFAPKSALKLVFVDIFAKTKAGIIRALITARNESHHESRNGGLNG